MLGPPTAAIVAFIVFRNVSAISVVVEIRHNVPGSGQPSRVAGAAQSVVLGANHANGILTRDGGGAIGRTVIDDDHLVGWVGESLESFQTVADDSGAVVAANHHRDTRPGQIPCERHFAKRLAHGRQRRLRLSVPVSEAEFPILHFRAAAEPFIGPGVNEQTRATTRKGGAKLPAERLRLHGFTVPITVQSHLGHDQGPVARDVVQAGEVRLEAGLRFEIDVEAGKIEEGELKVLGGRIVDVGHKAVGILRFHREIEAPEETFQFATAVPADDGSRDLVADGVTKDRRMAGSGADLE